MPYLIVRVKVRAGFYRVGALCIHRSRGRWNIYDGPKFRCTCITLAIAHEWASANQPQSVE